MDEFDLLIPDRPNEITAISRSKSGGEMTEKIPKSCFDLLTKLVWWGRADAGFERESVSFHSAPAQDQRGSAPPRLHLPVYPDMSVREELFGGYGNTRYHGG